MADDNTDDRYLCMCCACGCLWFRDEKGQRTTDPCRRSLVIEQTDMEACTQCGLCVDACPYEARTMKDGALQIDRAKCYGCSACEHVCPADAITMVPRT